MNEEVGRPQQLLHSGGFEWPAPPGPTTTPAGWPCSWRWPAWPENLTPPRPWAFHGYLRPARRPRLCHPGHGRAPGFTPTVSTTPSLGMLCLEMVGYYSHNPHQSLPLQLHGCSAISSAWSATGAPRPLSYEQLAAAIKRACRCPRATLLVPFQGHILPEVRLSDHASFWDEGYPAIMLTDTAFMRDPNYHGPGCHGPGLLLRP